MPPIPKAVKEQVIADLLSQKMSLDQIAQKHTLPLNSVKGVWGYLKQNGIVTKDAIPGVASVAMPPQQNPPEQPSMAPIPEHRPTVSTFVNISLSPLAAQRLDDWCRKNLEWGTSYDEAILKLIELVSRKRGRPRK